MAVGYIKRLAGPFSGAGTKTLPFGFKIFAPTDVYVALAAAESEPPATLVYGSDYTVTMNEEQDVTPGGTVELTTPLTDEQRVSVGTNIPYTQETQLTNHNRFPPVIVNTGLDRIVIQIQQIVEILGRAVIVEPTDTKTPLEMRYELLQATASALDAAAKALQSETNAASSAATSKEYADKLLAFKDQIVTVSENIKSVGITAENAEAIAAIAKNLEELLKSKDYAAEAKGWAEKANAITGGQAITLPGTTFARTVMERFADFINVRDFGAKGDNKTDDTISFQMAFNFAAKFGKIVLIPSGNYLCKEVSLGNYQKIVGMGRPKLMPISSAAQCLIGESITGLDISSLDFTCDAKQAIKLSDSKHIRLEDLSCTDFSTAIFATGCSDFVLKESGFVSGTYAGVIVACEKGKKSSNIRIIGNNFSEINDNVEGQDRDGQGIYVHGDEAVLPYGEADEIPGGVVTDVTITRNCISNNGRHGLVLLMCNGANVYGNYVEGHSGNILRSGMCVSVGCRNVSIKNNQSTKNYVGVLTDTMTNSGTTDSWAYGRISITDNLLINNTIGVRNNNVSRLDVSHNRVYGGEFGVYLIRFSFETTVIGNTIENCARNGIALSGASSDFTIFGNTDDTSLPENKYKDSPVTSSTLVANNIVVKCGNNSTEGNKAGILLQHGRNVILMNNIVKDSYKSLHIESNVESVKLIDNDFSRIVLISNASSVIKWTGDMSKITTVWSGSLNTSRWPQVVLDKTMLYHLGRSFWNVTTDSDKELTDGIQPGYEGLTVTYFNSGTHSFTVGGITWAPGETKTLVYTNNAWVKI